MNCSKAKKWTVTLITAVTTLITPAYNFYKSTLKNIFAVQFSRSQCMCWIIQISQPESWHFILDYALSGLLNALPCLTLIGTNTFLVLYAVKKSTRTVNKMNILIVVLITASFLISSLPYFAYYMSSGDVWDDSDGTLRLVTFAMFLVLWSNPIIYLATNRYFRRFLIRSVLRDGRRTSASVGRNSTVCQHSTAF